MIIKILFVKRLYLMTTVNILNALKTINMLNTFQDLLVSAYYYILIADGMVDPKELTFGNRMIEKEGIQKDDFENKLDELSNQETSIVEKYIKDSLKKESHENQLKVVAYMVKIADSDGVKDPHEMTSIQSITDELNLHVNDIIKAKEKLI